jgi:HAD superfamily hydrolase (TIGR01509 family)
MDIYIFDLDDTIIMHNNAKIIYENIRYDPTIDAFLSSLKGPKYIYTNGTYGHANAVLDQMGISCHFELIYARDTLDYMKPDPKSFLQVQKDVLDRENITTSYKIHFYDDQLNNLNTAFQLGWNTIWIHPRYKEKYKYYFVNLSTHFLSIT